MKIEYETLFKKTYNDRALQESVKWLVRSHLFKTMPECVEDAVQDIFIKFYERLVDETKPPIIQKNIRGFVLRIATNHSISLLRKHKVNLKRFGFRASLSKRERLESPNYDIEESIIVTERLESLISLLPKEQQEIINWRMQGGRFKEIAKITGISISTHLGRMHYARTNLAKILVAT